MQLRNEEANFRRAGDVSAGPNHIYKTIILARLRSSSIAAILFARFARAATTSFNATSARSTSGGQCAHVMPPTAKSSRTVRAIGNEDAVDVAAITVSSMAASLSLSDIF